MAASSVASGQCETEDQIAAAAPAFAAAGCDGHELLAVHHIHRGRAEYAAAGVELPQRFAGLRVECEQVSRHVAARAGKHNAPCSEDDASLAPAVERLLPFHFAARRIERRKVTARWTSRAERTVDRVHIEQAGARAVRNRS